MANNLPVNHIMKWKEVKESNGMIPKPRHGHRCVSYGKHIIIIGGGNEGIIKEINVYNTVNCKWFCPSTSGSPPPGCAAFGIVCYDSNLLIFGGIHEQGTYSNEIYRISLLNWNWSPVVPSCDPGIEIPLPRLGHSFTLSSTNDVYMFGGLTNEESAIPSGPPKYLNDLYKLSIFPDGQLHWSIPVTTGMVPCPRESHSGIIHCYKDRETLIIYGGMCGRRLGDIHFLDIESLVWEQPIVLGHLPPPRSLHVAGMCQDNMIVFGGWIPINDYNNDDDKIVYTENDWRCTNNVSCLNLKTLVWDNVIINDSEDQTPKPRAGHCGTIVNNRLYVWSGRDGFRKSWNDQVCCKDLWILETSKADSPGRIMMDGNETLSVNVKWDPIPNADFYIIQVMKVGHNTVCNSHDFKSLVQRNAQHVKRENIPIPNSNVPVSHALPPLKFVDTANTLRCDEVLKPEATEIKEEGTQYIDLKSCSVDNQNLDLSNISEISKTIDPQQVDVRNSWIELSNGKKIQAFTLVPKIEDNLQTDTVSTPKYTRFNVTPGGFTQDLDDTISINTLKANEMNLQTPQGKPMQIITHEDLLSRPFNMKPNSMFEASTPRNLPPLGVSLFPVAQPQRPRHLASGVSASPKSFNMFNEVPVGRWFESVIVSEPKSTITQFFVDVGYEKASNNRSNVNRRNISLEPNYTYRLRIASVNSCGIGPFSQPLTFSTSAPGLPGPPTGVKMVKKGLDTYLLWTPGSNNEILEYSVYISKPITLDTVLPVNIRNLKFLYEQIYQGKETKCLMSPHIEESYQVTDNSRSTVMLRIVAKNSKGYGPVTQIKWFKNETVDAKHKRSNSDKGEIPLKRFRIHS